MPKLSKKARYILSFVTAIVIITVLGFNNIGPLHSLSTKCDNGFTKVVDHGNQAGMYDYECVRQ